jgi:hypothetical protein
MSAPATPTSPTDAEIRLVEQYVRVLDFVSRCAQAIDHGDWYYLRHKAAQLQNAADGLARVAGETWEAIDAGDPRPRAEVVAAEVAYHGRHYRAGRLLHPLDPEASLSGGERP